jgi:hypothetical protein
LIVVLLVVIEPVKVVAGPPRYVFGSFTVVAAVATVVVAPLKVVVGTKLLSSATPYAVPPEGHVSSKGLPDASTSLGPVKPSATRCFVGS